MRALKTILIILLALIGLLLILGLVAGPKVTRVERSILIEAPREVIWPRISNLRNMHEWSPWKDAEQDQLNTWEGEDGTVGSIQKWVGDTVGVGSQRITALDTLRRVETELIFLKPWESMSKVELELAEEEGLTTVIWRMTQENDMMGRVFAVFVNMDKMIGPDFEHGLATLKARTEVEHEAALADLKARTFRGFVIDLVMRPATLYIGKRAKVKWSEMQPFSAATHAAAGAAIQAIQLPLAGPPSAVYFEWDAKNQRADYMPSFPVKADTDLRIPGMDSHVVQASSMLLLTVHGAYDQLAEAHRAMDEMIGAHGIAHYGNVIEEYLVSPATEPDTSSWVTHIFYMVREPGDRVP